MDKGIGLRLNNQTQLVIPKKSEQPDLKVIPQTGDAARTSSENGSVLSKREWLNRHAEDRKQKLTKAFDGVSMSGSAVDAVTADKPKNPTNPTWSDLVNLVREHEDFAEFRQQPKRFWQQVRQMSGTKIVKDNGGNETRTTSRYEELRADTRTKKLSPREFAKTLPPNEKAAFKACQQLRKTFGANNFNDDGITLNEAGQTRFREISVSKGRAADSRASNPASKFSLSGDAPAKTPGKIPADAPGDLLPRELAETPPPNERAIFEARVQTEETFGADLFNDDGVTRSEAGQIRFREISIDPRRAAGLSEGEFSLSGDALAVLRDEPMFGANSAALPGADVAVPQDFKVVVSGNSTLQNIAPVAVSPAASGNTAGASLVLSESFPPRVLTNAAPENITNNNAAARRDSGTVIGGALINGAFAAIDNYHNLENKEIGGSRAVGNVWSEGGDGFAAGATGAMFGAAVGKVIPGAGTVVGGVLGFVSSVVVGVEVDQGLRWLGAGGMTFDANNGEANANDQNQLTTDNSFTTKLNLQPASA